MADSVNDIYVSFEEVKVPGGCDSQSNEMNTESWANGRYHERISGTMTLARKLMIHLSQIDST
jgi:hypothetical protein